MSIFDYQIEKDVVCETHRKLDRNEKTIQYFTRETLRNNSHVRDPGAGGRIIIIKINIKVVRHEFSLERAMKAQRGSRVIALLFFNPGTR